MVRRYFGAGWPEVLRFNGLEDFDALWMMQAGWFEEPNKRRGGWSGVSRIVLKLPEGGETVVFVKRQENHMRRTLLHPVQGEPTFRGEIGNILSLRSAGIPTLEPLYYAERKTDAGWQCILITSELTDYQSLDELLSEQGWEVSRGERQALLYESARVIARMHANRLVHRALYPKHLFVNVETASVCLIDLEKMRHVLFRNRAMLRDLDSLNRHASCWSRSDRLRFLLCYLGQARVTPVVRKIWYKLLLKSGKKR